MADRLRDLAALFAALADPTRLRILSLLVGGEVCVCDIHESLRLPQPTVSRHLAYLRRAGLVDARRAGVWMHYRLAALEDPSARAAVSAAIHAAGHRRAVGVDQRRLHQRMADGRPAATLLPVASCCGLGGEDARAAEPEEPARR
jgi:ArsR family transcriptional regulator